MFDHKVKIMKTSTGISHKNGKRASDYPELQVGFPERNDATNPNIEMERIHVDMATFDISRKNAHEVTKAIAEQETSETKK